MILSEGQATQSLATTTQARPVRALSCLPGSPPWWTPPPANGSEVQSLALPRERGSAQPPGAGAWEGPRFFCLGRSPRLVPWRTLGALDRKKGQLSTIASNRPEGLSLCIFDCCLLCYVGWQRLLIHWSKVRILHGPPIKSKVYRATGKPFVFVASPCNCWCKQICAMRMDADQPLHPARSANHLAFLLAPPLAIVGFHPAQRFLLR